MTPHSCISRSLIRRNNVIYIVYTVVITMWNVRQSGLAQDEGLYTAFFVRVLSSVFTHTVCDNVTQETGRPFWEGNVDARLKRMDFLPMESPGRSSSYYPVATAQSPPVTSCLLHARSSPNGRERTGR